MDAVRSQSLYALISSGWSFSFPLKPHVNSKNTKCTKLPLDVFYYTENIIKKLLGEGFLFHLLVQKRWIRV